MSASSVEMVRMVAGGAGVCVWVGVCCVSVCVCFVCFVCVCVTHTHAHTSGAKDKTHYYPMAMATHNIFPPPQTVGGKFGEV